MTTNYEIINPQEDNLIGIFTYDPGDEDDPLFELRKQSKMVAAQQLIEGVPFNVAAGIVWQRMSDLFGETSEGIEGVVRSSVFLQYIHSGVLQHVPDYLKNLIQVYDEKGTDPMIDEFAKLTKGMKDDEGRALLAEILKVTRGT